MLILYSPLQMASDLPENYVNNPAFGFIENLPTTWDETRVLDARIGEYIVLARRKDKTWYVAAITNESERKISIPLDFLEKDHSYKTIEYLDAPNADFEKNPEAFEIKESKFKLNDPLIINLAPGGGAALILNY